MGSERASWRKWHLSLDLKHSGKKRGEGWGEVAPRRGNVRSGEKALKCRFLSRMLIRILLFRNIVCQPKSVLDLEVGSVKKKTGKQSRTRKKQRRLVCKSLLDS